MQISKDTVQATARLGGLLYLIIIVIGVVGEALIRNGLVVPRDAAATAELALDDAIVAHAAAAPVRSARRSAWPWPSRPGGRGHGPACR